jgi:hypothetical protein
LEEHKYVHKCRSKCESTTNQYIFWAHSKSTKLVNTSSSVLIIDSTYKINVYIMSLFKIVRVTSAVKTYFVGFAFMTSEERKKKGELHMSSTNIS